MEPMFDPPKTEGGLVIPGTSQQRCTQGIVKYLGPLVSEELKVGDHVAFSGWDGTLARLDVDGIFIIMPEDSIKFVIMPKDFYEVPGLYLRDKLETSLQVQLNEIVSVLNDYNIYSQMNKAEKIFSLGYRKQPYFKADYESVIFILNQGLKNNKIKSGLEIKDKMAMSREELG